MTTQNSQTEVENHDPMIAVNIMPEKPGNTRRGLTTTSVSINTTLLEKARLRAAQSYRTFSQYVSFLLHQDLNRAKAKVSQNGTEISED